MKLLSTSNNLPIERFEADLQTACGQFNVYPTKGTSNGWGGVALNSHAGIETAVIATDMQQIIRTSQNIKQDFGENYFLIMQQEGRALMAQNNASVMLMPGDLILIDSAKPSEFTFYGDRSIQISLHLPRIELQDQFGADVPGGLSLSGGDPTAKALQAVIAKSINVDPKSPLNIHLRDALFGLLGAFLCDRDVLNNNLNIQDNAMANGLLGKALEVVEIRFRHSEFTGSDIAIELGINARQLQRAFKNINVTPTKYLLAKRLEFAKSQLDLRLSGHHEELISQIAYRSGFSDLSYFNRRFREAFGCSPGQYGSH